MDQTARGYAQDHRDKDIGRHSARLHRSCTPCSFGVAIVYATFVPGVAIVLLPVG
jgi:hypothetical protein